MENKAHTNNYEIKQSDSYTVFIGVLFLCFIMMIFEVPISNFIFSLGIAVYCVFVLMLNIKVVPLKELLLLVVFFMLIFISTMINSSGREFMCNLFSLLVVLLLNSRLRIRKNALKWYYLMYVALGIFILLFAPLGDMKSTIIPNTLLSEVNPNTSAFYMVLLYMISVCLILSEKEKIWYFAVAIFSVIAVILFKARTSLLGVLTFTVFLWILKFINSKRKTSFLFFLCIAGVIFAYFYSVTLYEMIGPGKITILGKDLFTGRNLIWSSAFRQLEGHYWFGIGNSIGDSGNAASSYTYNFHNQFLAIITMYGIPVLLMFSLCYTRYINLSTDNILNYRKVLAIGIALTLMSYFETFFQSVRLMILIAIALAFVLSMQDAHEHTERRNL